MTDVKNNENNEIDEMESVVAKELIKRPIEEEMVDAYTEYAASVIVERALPDGRDGFKPVHRRILHALNELAGTSYKKSARIVGDVIGKYHPHGDTAVYDAMVRMAQPFSLRTLLIDGQGNFGSIDGDSAAAMRYTESRMTQLSKSIFDDIKKDTVRFLPNYSGEEEEPSVLPVRFPNLIINGVSGVAVGMASDIPPHNPIEAMEVIRYKLNNRIENVEDDLSIMMKIMPAPDFPTGGHIHDLENYADAWTTGRMTFKVRAKWEEIELSGGRTAINITEIPYMLKKELLISDLRDKTRINPETRCAIIDGISVVNEYSDKDGLRIELIVKNDFNAEDVMNKLFASTSLEKTMTYNATVLLENKETNTMYPKVVGLNKLFDLFIDFRKEVVTNRTNYELTKYKEKLHILSALIKAIDPNNIDNVISLIKRTKELAEARAGIMELLGVDEIQATEILNIRLSRLTGMEVDNITNQINDLNVKIEGCLRILMEEKVLLEVILEESEEIQNHFLNFVNKKTSENAYNKVKYAYKNRLSTWQTEKLGLDLSSTTKEEECCILMSAKGFVRRIPITELSTLNRGARGKKQMKLKKDDSILLSFNSHSHDDLMFITNKGQSYVIPAYEIPSVDKGRNINYLLELSDANEKVVSVIPVDYSTKDSLIAMFTKNGLIKLSYLQAYVGAKRKGGVRAITLKENDSILSATICNVDDYIFMVNNKNKIVRFSVSEISIVGRTASGVRGMKLDKDCQIVGADTINSTDGFIICVSKNGLIKLTDVVQYKIQARGGKGCSVMKVNERSGDLFNAFYAKDLNDDVVYITKNGYSNRRPLNEFSITDRSTTGVKLLTLEDKDSIVDIYKAPHIEEFEIDETESEEIISTQDNGQNIEENLYNDEDQNEIDLEE